MKRESPYTRLQRIVRKWVYTAQFPRSVTMWIYPKDKLDSDWDLTSLAERVKAADQLGYRVELEWVEEKGLRVVYRKRPDDPPMEVR